MNDDDLEYIIRLYRLDEIQNKLSNKAKTIFDDDDCRSPSPDPIYNDTGKRINTRDQREGESIQKERYDIIEESVRINPTFVPPHDYKVKKMSNHYNVLKSFIIFKKDRKEAKKDLFTRIKC